MNKNCLLCGVGGQGTVLASKLIARAAIACGMQARTAETIGMAQRGGSVVSHVRIGKTIHSPLIPKGTADVLIAFEPGEAVRCLSYLKKDGIVVVNSKAVQPSAPLPENAGYSADAMIRYLQSVVTRCIVVDTEAVCAETGSAKVSNTVLLGAAAASGMLGLSLNDMENVINSTIPAKYREINIRALAGGARTATDIIRNIP
jgi:indolepyruvate ferredoxin oxidoreductase beta subunit